MTALPEPADGSARLRKRPAATGDVPDQALPRSRRLRRSAHFQEAFAQKKSVVGRYMVIWIREADDARQRVGIISSRKVGMAVLRNRARRKIREAWRANRHRLLRTADVVIVTRRAINEATAQDVTTELIHLLTRRGLMESNKGQER